MEFSEAKERARNYRRAGVAIFFVSAIVCSSAPLKALYFGLAFSCKNTPLFAKINCSVGNLIAGLFNNVPPYTWLWGWLPDMSRIPFQLFWLNPIFIPSFFLFLVSIMLINSGSRLNSKLQKAEEEVEHERYKDGARGGPASTTGQSGGVRNVQAGRDVTIIMKEWDKKPTQNPTTVWILGILGTVLSAVIGAWLLSMLGLKS